MVRLVLESRLLRHPGHGEELDKPAIRCNHVDAAQDQRGHADVAVALHGERIIRRVTGWACQMAAAPKAMVTSTTIPAARQRALTLVCVLPASVVCLLADICYLAHSR